MMGERGVQASPTLGEALAMAQARVEGRETPAPAPLPAPPGPRKYRNEPQALDGIRFASRKEAARWLELKAMQAAGLVRGLEPHPSFDLAVGGVLVCRYVADFAYVLPDGTRVVEDAKSPATRRNRAYRIKRKLMEAVHGIDVREV